MFIEPMLASKPKDGKSISDYSSSDFVLEEKFDGHRLIVTVEAGKSVQAWSRVGNVRVLNAKLVNQLKKSLPSCTLDGELYLPGGTSTDVTTTETLGLLEMVFFDILEIDGHDATKRGGIERRKMLEVATSKIDGKLHIAEQLEPTEENLHTVWNRGGEGGILKARDARYEPGKRSRNWVKLKKEGSAIVTVVGFEEGLNGPYATVVGKSEDGNLVPVKTLNREEIRQFSLNPKAAFGRRLMISFQNRTSSGSFRHPMWDRWCEAGD
jgi:ATP-dependent DNA ligase